MRKGELTMADNKVLDTPQFDKSLLKSVGEDVFIDAFVHIRRPQMVSVGNHTAIDWGVYITTAARIGDYVHIAPYVTIIGGTVGNLSMDHFTTIAAGSRIICASDGHLGDGLVGPTIPEEFQDKKLIAPVIFERFASVATNVVVMPGVYLAEGVVIAACSLMRFGEKTDPWTIYKGIPAKPFRERPREKMLEYAKRLGY